METNKNTNRIFYSTFIGAALQVLTLYIGLSKNGVHSNNMIFSLITGITSITLIAYSLIMENKLKETT